jgi:predicted lysophospholipase L1 biosynthesis ABC-type transport system permease subunit
MSVYSRYPCIEDPRNANVAFQAESSECLLVAEKRMTRPQKDSATSSVSAKQAPRRSGTLSFLATIRQDVCFAARQLSKSSGFAFTAIVEIGVRMALGAQRASVYHLILKEACWLAALGVAGGVFCSVVVANLLRSLLFAVRPWDITTLLSVGFVLAASTLVASYIPARRAASIDPAEALRAE